MSEDNEVLAKWLTLEKWKVFQEYLKSLKPLSNQTATRKTSNDSHLDNDFFNLEVDTKVGARLDPSGVQMNADAHARGKLSWESLRLLLFFLPKPKGHKHIERS